MSDNAVFVIIHGNDWSLRDQEPNDYVAKIVYGSPKVTTVVDSGKFVSLVEYSEEEYSTARQTMERMGSFSYGASLMVDRLIALREFGTWLCHNAPTKEPAKPEWIYEG
jgi:hypothetical protein